MKTYAVSNVQELSHENIGSKEQLTIGIDLVDRFSQCCVLGAVLRNNSFGNLTDVESAG